MIGPFYRWKSFWLGVLVLCFLGWGWVRSMELIDGVSWQRATKTSSHLIQIGDLIAMGQSGGVVYLSWASDYPVVEKGVSQWSLPLARFKGMDPRDLFPMVILAEGEPFPAAVVVKHGAVIVAHWLLWLVFFLTWSAWMMWRWRRDKFASVQFSVLRKDR